MIDVVIATALREALRRLPPYALGVRSHAIPTDNEHLDACLRAIEELQLDPEFRGCIYVVGSSTAAPGQLPLNTLVLQPDAAAAQATRIRNSFRLTAHHAPSTGCLVYLNADSTPGEAGLDGLTDLGAQAVARHFAERANLSVLAQLAQTKHRRLLQRLGDATVRMLASYAEAAKSKSELFALPWLGLIPRDFGADQPLATWASEFDALTGEKLISRLRETLAVLDALPALERGALAQKLRERQGRLLPPHVRDSDRADEIVGFLASLCRATIDYAGGRLERLPDLCGLSAGVLRLLKKGDELKATLREGPPDEDGTVIDLSDGSSGGRPRTEEDVLRSEGLAGLPRGVREIAQDGKELVLGSDAEGGELKLKSRDGAGLVAGLLRILPVSAWTEGAGIEVRDRDMLLRPVQPESVAADARDKLGNWRRELTEPLKTCLAEFLSRRGDLIRALAATIHTESDDATDDAVSSEQPDLDGILLAEAFPMTAVSMVSPEVAAYIAAYERLVAEAFGHPDSPNEVIGTWLTNLDVAYCATRGQVNAARLMPLHPLRLAHVRTWLELRRRPPMFPPSLIVHWRSEDVLMPQGRDYTYHRPDRVGPSNDGLAVAAREGVGALWTLLAPIGLVQALRIELVDVANPSAAIEAICEEVVERFEDELATGDGVHIQVVCAYSETNREEDARPPTGADLFSVSAECVAARRGLGVSLEIDPAAQRAGTRPYHLSINAIETPFRRLASDVATQDVPGTEAVYLPSASGNIAAIRMKGNTTLDAYYKVLEHLNVPTIRGFAPVESAASPGRALIRTLVAAGGWPVRPLGDDGLLSYSEEDDHVVVSLCAPDILQKKRAAALSELSRLLDPPETLDPAVLREGLVALYACRNFFQRLLEKADPRHLLGDLGLLRAFSAVRREEGAVPFLVVSLDGPEGREWTRLVAGMAGGQETRADLLVLEGTPDLSRVVRIRIAELKARTSSADLSEGRLRQLAKQPQVTAARVRLSYELTDVEERRRLSEALRRVVWLGAGRQLAAKRWQEALRNFDSDLVAQRPPQIAAECWIVPEEAWGGAPTLTLDVPRLTASGSEEPSTERVRFRILTGQGLRGLGSTSRPAAPLNTPQSPVGPSAAVDSGRNEPTPPSKGPDLGDSDTVDARVQIRKPADMATPAIGSQGAPNAAPEARQQSPAEAPIEKPIREPPKTPPQPAGQTPAVPDRSLNVPLGTDIGDGKPVSWRPYDTNPRLSNQHILLVGKSGSGKSETTKALIWELDRRGVPSIIFDFQGEYGDARKDFHRIIQPQVFDVMAGLPINPFDVPRDPLTGEPRRFIESVFRLADTLNRVFRGSGDIQLGILRDAIRACYTARGFDPDKRDTWANQPPTIDDLKATLEHAAASARGGQVRNLLVRLQPLFDSGIFASGRAQFRLEDLFRRTTVLLLNSGISDLMLAASRFTLEAIYAAMISNGESATTRVMACVDEAHKLCGDETITTLIKEARKYGLGLLLSSQETRDFHPSVFANVGTLIALQLEENDASIMAKQIAGPDAARQRTVKRLIMTQAFPVGVVRSNHFQPYASVKLTPFHQRISEAPPATQSAPSPATPASPAAEPRPVFLDEYELVKLLPGGGMAEVYQARDRRTGENVCVKRVRANSGDAVALSREAAIYSKLQGVDSPNLLRVRDYIPGDEYVTLVMDFAPGGDLATFVRGETNSKLKPTLARSIAIQVASGLRELHSRGIVHRDLKPENVLLNGEHWQLADFGIAKSLSRLMTVRTLMGAGTIGYMAPEQRDGSEANPSADIYSLGKLIVFMLTGYTDKDYVTQPGWIALVSACVAEDPERRPTVDRVLEDLERIRA